MAAELSSRSQDVSDVPTAPVALSVTAPSGAVDARTIPAAVARLADTTRLRLILERNGRDYYVGPGLPKDTVCFVVVENEIDSATSCDEEAQFQADGLFIGDETEAAWLLPETLTSADSSGRPLEVAASIAFLDEPASGARLEARGPDGQSAVVSVPTVR